MSKRDLSEETYERLRDLIVRGRLKPEKRLIEAELAREFGVSRTPVRDAIARLLHEGYVREAARGARSGVEVAPLKRADVDELWQLLGNLEAGAARSAAELPEDRRRRVVARLRATNDELSREANKEDGSPDRLMELQSAFHRELVAASGGPWLKQVYESIRPHAERYEWVYGWLGEADLSLSTAEHEDIVELIEDGRADAAADAIRRHWLEASKRTGGLIEAYWG